MTEFERTQEPNIRAANEHLHRRIAELEAQVEQWRFLYRDAAARRDELEAMNCELNLGERSSPGSGTEVLSVPDEQLNGEAA